MRSQIGIYNVKTVTIGEKVNQTYLTCTLKKGTKIECFEKYCPGKDSPIPLGNGFLRVDLTLDEKSDWNEITNFLQ